MMIGFSRNYFRLDLHLALGPLYYWNLDTGRSSGKESPAIIIYSFGFHDVATAVHHTHSHINILSSTNF